MSSSFPFDWSSSGESEIGLLDFRDRLRRLVGRSFLLSAGVVFLGLLVALTFVAYLTGSFDTDQTKLVFALYVVLATLLYAVTLIWGNLEQRRSRRAESAPELVLEPGDGDLVVSNVGTGPAIDARVVVAVDGERIYDELLPVVRTDETRPVASLDGDDASEIVLGVWSGTRLADVEYRVERTYDGESLAQ